MEIGRFMFKKIIDVCGLRLVFVLASAIFLTGCTTPGLLKDNETAFVSKVVVSKARDGLGTVNIAEDVRVKTLRESQRFPAGGRSKTVKVLLTSFRAKDGITGLLVNDFSYLNAVATVVDDSTNETDGSFELSVKDTSRAGLNGLAGLVVANFDSPIWIEQRLADDLAKKIMVKVYGSDRAKKIAAVGPMPPANYPANYEELQKKYRCKKSREFPVDKDSVEVAAPVSCG